MKNNLIIVSLTSLLVCSVFVLSAQLSGDTFKTSNGNLKIQPILHATMALEWNDKVIYVDPYGGKSSFANLPRPDLILITDIHGDHMNVKTLEELGLQDVEIVAPKAVTDKLPDTFSKKTILDNGQTITKMDISIKGVPMYNLPESEDSRHTKGRGNGYVLTFGGVRVYISGDTEDVPEMRVLTDIDVAFVCMNLPYTMEVAAAADAVLEFKPKIVYPFHYRGKGGLSDVDEFKRLVNNGDENIEVRLRQWYPAKDE